MNTLKVSDIFNQISFYQQNYQSILSDATQYKTVVEDAVIDVWPFASQKLYLGDLLQLWLSQKWRVTQACEILHHHSINALFSPSLKEDDLYVYQIDGNAVLGKAVAKVWRASEQRSIEVILESSLQYYCTYKIVA